MEVLHYANNNDTKALCGEVNAIFDDGEEIGIPCQLCLHKVNMKVTPELLAAFVRDQQARYDTYVLATTPKDVLEEYPDIHKCIHVTRTGPRFVRITREQVGSKYGGSVVCFIDLTNGDILKGSAKGPVKNGVRGNLHTEDRGASCMTEYGTAYLR